MKILFRFIAPPLPRRVGVISICRNVMICKDIQWYVIIYAIWLMTNFNMNCVNKFCLSPYSSSSVRVYRRWRTQKVPSSGLIMLAIAETFCQNMTLYGFYPYAKDPSGNPVLYHYYQPNLTDFHTNAHDFDKEHKMLRSLQDQGFLRLVIDPCGKWNDFRNICLHLFIAYCYKNIAGMHARPPTPSPLCQPIALSLPDLWNSIRSDAGHRQEQYDQLIVRSLLERCNV